MKEESTEGSRAQEEILRHIKEHEVVGVLQRGCLMNARTVEQVCRKIVSEGNLMLEY